MPPHIRRVLLALSAAAATGLLTGCVPAAEASTPTPARPVVPATPPDADGFYMYCTPINRTPGYYCTPVNGQPPNQNPQPTPTTDPVVPTVEQPPPPAPITPPLPTSELPAPATVDPPPPIEPTSGTEPVPEGAPGVDPVA